MSKYSILRNAYRKLDGMPLSFGLPMYSNNITDEDLDYYMGLDLNDTLRELKLTSADAIQEMSETEFHVENRVVYYALRRFRNSSSVFFKYSTATDGKTVDKTSIPKIIMSMLTEYDNEFRKWRRTSKSGSSWDIASTINTTGEVSTTE